MAKQNKTINPVSKMNMKWKIGEARTAASVKDEQRDTGKNRREREEANEERRIRRGRRARLTGSRYSGSGCDEFVMFFQFRIEWAGNSCGGSAAAPFAESWRSRSWGSRHWKRIK
jgi:hypothetical protein